MLARLARTQTVVESWSTACSLRPSTPTDSMKVKITSTIVNLTGRSRRKVAAITRGSFFGA